MSPTLNVNPTLFVIPCTNNWMIINLHYCNYSHLPSNFSSKFNENISSKVADKRRKGFGQWMNSSIIHDEIYTLIRKKCHPKSYNSDIEYHMTLNIIFSVVLAVYDEERCNCYYYKFYIVMIGSIRGSNDFWGFVKFPTWRSSHLCIASTSLLKIAFSKV